MPLQSKLFKGDPRLEECLVEDGAHVTRGTQGPYVWKIQRALLLLDGHMIHYSEQEQQFFGSATSKAVYEYRKRRNIRRGDQPVTDIVGKMTIFALDSEMVQYESAIPGTTPPAPTTPGTHPPTGKPGEGMCGPLRQVAHGTLNPVTPRATIRFKGGMDAVFEFQNFEPFEALVGITHGSGSRDVVKVPRALGPMGGKEQKTYLKIEPTPVAWDFALDASASTTAIHPPGIPPITVPNPWGKPVVTPPVHPPPLPVALPFAVYWIVKTDWQVGDFPCAAPVANPRTDSLLAPFRKA